MPLVKELARIAAGTEPPLARLEGALEILFGAYAAGAPEFVDLLLEGFTGARRDRHHRLTLAWQREQLRLSLVDILTEGQRAGAVRPAVDAGAAGALMLGAAEAGLLLPAAEGHAVTPGEQVRALLALVRTEA